MNFSAVEKIANAVLYEGYLLYPYRPSAIKNQQRFNFGVLYPVDYCDLQGGTESSEMLTQCVLDGTSATTIEVKVRFLQMGVRDGRQEGIEREVSLPPVEVESIVSSPARQQFEFGPARATEGPRIEHLRAELELSGVRVAEHVYRIALRVSNRSCGTCGRDPGRDEALLQAMVSVHSLLHTDEGRFFSMIDPPGEFRSAAAECRNVGTFPVLAGEEGQTDLMLSSPIILYDYPQIAPESPGDLCDGTEIDEILALRILTMSDAEKLEIRNGDERARAILERTEMLPPEHFEKLHGVLRSLPAKPETRQ